MIILRCLLQKKKIIVWSFKITHQIINDKGLQGAFYKYSNCGEIYWDILDKINYKQCPTCKVSIDEGKEEYYKDPNGDWRRYNAFYKNYSS